MWPIRKRPAAPTTGFWPQDARPMRRSRLGRAFAAASTSARRAGLWTALKYVFEVVVVATALWTVIETHIQNTRQNEQDYIARRAELFATLFDRKESCTDDEKDDKKRCPVKADLRTREEALKAFASIEHNRDTPKLSLAFVDVARANLIGVVLWQADLWWADFSNAQVIDADLTLANLREANLRGTNLTQTSLRCTDLRGIRFHGTDLTRADLSDAAINFADFTLANLSGAILIRANLSGADLRNAYNLTQSQLDGAIGDDKTHVPKGLRPPPTRGKQHDCTP